MISAVVGKNAIDRLSLMPMFPRDEGAHKALARALSEMCANDEQLIWLIGRVVRLYSNWPGENELRAVLSSKFKPIDGVRTYSVVYRDGIPSESLERRSIACGKCGGSGYVIVETACGSGAKRCQECAPKALVVSDPDSN